MTGWSQVTLGDVASIQRTAVDPSDVPSDTFYIGLEDVEKGGSIVNVRAAGEANLTSMKFKFTERHVLFGKLRPYLAKIALPGFEGICSTDIIPILPGPELDRSYLGYFLRHPNTVALAAARATGANLPRISPKQIAAFKIPLPPLEYQKRIVTVLEQADALIANSRQTTSLLDDLAQSIFFEMFGDLVRNERDWPRSSVGSLVDGFESGKSLAEGESDETSEYRILKISAVTSGRFMASESKPAPKGYVPPNSHFVREGDLLFSRANTSELIGATAFVPSDARNLLMPDKLWRFVWNDEVKPSPWFVHYLFKQPSVREMIRRNSSGSSGSMKNISQKKVLTMEMGLPPVSLQEKFEREVLQVEAVRKNAQDREYSLAELFASLQTRAFRGEL